MYIIVEWVTHEFSTRIVLGKLPVVIASDQGYFMEDSSPLVPAVRYEMRSIYSSIKLVPSHCDNLCHASVGSDRIVCCRIGYGTCW